MQDGGSWPRDRAARLADALRAVGAPLVAVGAVEGSASAVETLGDGAATGRFELGSIGKTMTALVCAQLVVEGAMAAEDQVSRWLDAGDNGTVTITELVTHTSGLPRLAPNQRARPDFDPRDPHASFGPDLAEAGLRAARVDGRGAVRYSNFGYQLLGICAERATGTELRHVLRRIVFEPAGMAGAVVHPDPGAVGGCNAALSGTDPAVAARPDA